MLLLFQPPRKQPAIFTAAFTSASSFLLGNGHLRSQPKIKNKCLPISQKITLLNICIGILWGFFNKSCSSRLLLSGLCWCASAAQTYVKRQIMLQRPSHQWQGDGQALVTVLQVKQRQVWVPWARRTLSWYNSESSRLWRSSGSWKANPAAWTSPLDGLDGGTGPSLQKTKENN